MSMATPMRACEATRPSDAQRAIGHLDFGLVDATPLKKARKVLRERGPARITPL